MSCSNKDMKKKKTSTSREPIRFLRIVLGHYREFKFKLPKVFVREYGNTLSNSAHIQAPTGPKWKVELIKCGGEIWFRKGWKDFVNHFSLREGSSLLFEYEGDSRFNVLFIGDPSAMESKYPIDSSSSREEITNRDVKEEIQGDDGEGEFQTVSRKYGSTKTGLAQASGRISASRRCVSFEAPRTRRKQPLATKRKATALPSDKGNSKSQHPYFEAEMRPSYVTAGYLHIPGSSWKEHLTMEEGDIILRNWDGGTWPVCYKVNERYARFNGGWKEFVMDNKLKVGDKCRFELQNKQGIEICFLVTITRSDGEDANHHFAAAHGNETSQLGSGFSSKHEAITPPSAIPPKKMKIDEHGKLPLEEVQGDSDRAASRPIQRLSSIGSGERASRLNSNHPSFKLEMTSNFLQSPCPTIPESFCKEHLSCISQEDVTLQVKDKSWTVRLISCSDTPGRLGRGWITFELDNNLKLGDVCVFEMIKTKPFVFKVSISSASLS